MKIYYFIYNTTILMINYINILDSYPNSIVCNVSDGASLKKIYRINYDTKNYIVIDFTAYKNNNIHFTNYLSTYMLLKKTKCLIPEIYYYTKNKKLILTEDLGNKRLYNLYIENITTSAIYYRSTIDWLIKFQKIKNVNNYYTYQNMRTDINSFMNSILTHDKIFPKLEQEFDKLEQEFDKLEQEFDKLCNEIYSQKHIPIHKDFQSKNLMIYYDNIYAINFQDLTIGPEYYDIVSLLYGVNINMREDLREHLIKYYYDNINNNKDTYNEYKHKIYVTALFHIIISLTHRCKLYYKKKKYEIYNDFIKGKYIITILKKKLKNYTLIFEYLDKYLPSGLITVILGVGKGSRMNSHLPKVLVPLNNKPIIKYVIDQAKSVNSDHILLVVGYKKDLIINTLQNENINFITQSQQLGTGHAIKCCKYLLNGFIGNILVLMGDAPLVHQDVLNKFINDFEKNNYDMSMLTKSCDKKNNCGKVIRDIHNNFDQIIKNADYLQMIKNNINIKKNTEVATSVSIYKSIELFLGLEEINNNNIQNEYYLSDVFNIAKIHNKLIGIYKSYELPEIHAINSMDNLKKLKI